MPNIVIYINTSNHERFLEEKNKSGLINHLLEEHYGSTPKSFIQTVKEPKKREVFEERAERSSEGFCPMGHSIPTGRSKCMGKGCKYAH